MKNYTETAVWKYYLRIEEKHRAQQEKFEGDYSQMNKYEAEYFEACEMAEEIKNVNTART